MKMQKWFIFKLYCGLSFCHKGSIYLQADEKKKKKKCTNRSTYDLLLTQSSFFPFSIKSELRRVAYCTQSFLQKSFIHSFSFSALCRWIEKPFRMLNEWLLSYQICLRMYFFFSFFVISIFHYYFSYASKMLRELGKKKKVLKRTTDTESCWNQRRKDVMYIRYCCSV